MLAFAVQIWSNAYFPQSRPLLYNFRDFSQVQSASCTKQSSGAYIIKVVHKPITGVTPDMLTWMFTQGLRMSSVSIVGCQRARHCFLDWHRKGSRWAGRGWVIAGWAGRGQGIDG